MSAVVADADYSPYDFIITLTCVFGAIFIVGPLLVPRGPDRETIRIGIMLSSFHMWLAWVTVYSSQVHPTSGLSFSRSTLSWLTHAWGSVKGIEPVVIPTTKSTARTTRTTRTTTLATTTLAQPATLPFEFIITTRRTRTTTTTTTPLTITTSTTPTITSTTTVRTTTTKKTTTTRTQKWPFIIDTGPVRRTFTVFELEKTGPNSGMIEMETYRHDHEKFLASNTPPEYAKIYEQIRNTSEIFKKTVYQEDLAGLAVVENYRSFVFAPIPPQGKHPQFEVVYKNIPDNSNKTHIMLYGRRPNHQLYWIQHYTYHKYLTRTRFEWSDTTITFLSLSLNGKHKTELFKYKPKDKFEIKYGGVANEVWFIHKGLIQSSVKHHYYHDTQVMPTRTFGVWPISIKRREMDYPRHTVGWNYHRLWDVKKVDKNSYILDEIVARRGDMHCTMRTKRVCTTDKLRSRTQTDFLLARPMYAFYRITGEPISFSVLAELDDYREFYVLLSTTSSRSKPRIMIHIGANNGRECTISKNGMIMVRMKCKPEWRRNVYLPFFIWYHDGNIVVKSGHDGAEQSSRLVHWDDPDPFDVRYYGIRSSGDDDIPMLVKNVENEEDWELD